MFLGRDQPDVSWIHERQDDSGALRVASFVPTCYETYLRAAVASDRRDRKAPHQQICEDIASVLVEFTDSPDRCVFLFHPSWGTLLPSTSMRSVEIRSDEDYFATQASVLEAAEFSVEPTLWWPEDRRWFVCCVLDSKVALVGCSHSAADALRQRSELVIEIIRLEDPIEFGSDSFGGDSTRPTRR